MDLLCKSLAYAPAGLGSYAISFTVLAVAQVFALLNQAPCSGLESTSVVESLLACLMTILTLTLTDSHGDENVIA